MPSKHSLPNFLSRLDHLVLAVPSLPYGIQAIEEKLGVRAVYGGRHPGLGTHNALIHLGNKSYLEIIGPDPRQEIAGPLWFGIDKVQELTLVSWAIQESDIESSVEGLHQIGAYPGPIQDGSRLLSDGTYLTWRYTDPRPLLGDGIVPFFIDWGTSPHPTDSLEQDIVIQDMKAVHPQVNTVKKMLDVLQIEMIVEQGATPELQVLLNTPKGQIWI